jgi:hypothetical protein
VFDISSNLLIWRRLLFYPAWVTRWQRPGNGMATVRDRKFGS